MANGYESNGAFIPQKHPLKLPHILRSSKMNIYLFKYLQLHLGKKTSNWLFQGTMLNKINIYLQTASKSNKLSSNHAREPLGGSSQVS